jgi:hypothetical protein
MRAPRARFRAARKLEERFLVTLEQEEQNERKVKRADSQKFC